MRLRKALFLLFLFSSCQTGVTYRLNSVEAIMREHPDSALTILQSIPSYELNNHAQMAKHALLTSMALDKNYIDVAEDSIINVAVDYYSQKGSAEEKTKSWYYQGIVRKNAGRYPAAIVSLELAEREALKTKDNHMLGLIYRNKADIFSLNINNVASIQYGEKAVEAFEANGDSLYAIYENYSLVVDYLNDVQFDKAHALLNDLQKCTLPDQLRAQCNLCYARYLVEKGDSVEKAIPIFCETPEEYLSVIDYGLFATALYNVGRKESAFELINKAYGIFDNKEMRATLQYLHSKLAYKDGDLNLAYALEDKALHVQDSLTMVLLQQSLSNAQRDYYRDELTIQEGIVKRQKAGMIYGIIIMILLLSIFSIALLHRKQKRDSAIMEQMARLSLSRNDTLQSNAYLIGALTKERMIRLYNLSDDYFREEDSNKRERKLNSFNKALREIRSDNAFFCLIEADLNKYCNGIMDKLSSQVPQIKGARRRLIVLFFAGFPKEWILILGNQMSPGSIKTARSRLRTIIKEAQASDEALFLKMLEYK